MDTIHAFDDDIRTALCGATGVYLVHAAKLDDFRAVDRCEACHRLYLQDRLHYDTASEAAMARSRLTESQLRLKAAQEAGEPTAELGRQTFQLLIECLQYAGYAGRQTRGAEELSGD